MAPHRGCDHRGLALSFEGPRPSSPPRTLRALLAACLVAACSRSGHGADDGGSSAEVGSAAPSAVSADHAAPAPERGGGPPPAADAASLADAGFVPASVEPVEARRARIRKWSEDAALEGAGALLDAHFAESPQPPGNPRPSRSFDVQATPLTAAGRRVVVVSEADRPASEARPFAFVAAGPSVLWTKPRPTAGILPPTGPFAIAAAPRGRVAIAVCDPPTSSVALRVWDDDGSPFADFQALSIEQGSPQPGREDSLTLMYWPRHGWLIVAARVGLTRAQLVSDSGTPMWAANANQGLDLGARSREGAVAPASVTASTDDTFVLVQLVQPEAVADSPFHALAFRYDVEGTAIWPAAVDLGALSRAPSPGERARLSGGAAGAHVSLPDGAEIDLKPSGAFTRQGPRPKP